MKRLQLNILFFLTLITNICFADIFLTNNNPFTTGKSKFDFSIGGALPLLPPVSKEFDFFTRSIGILSFGYGLTNKVYIRVGTAPLIQPNPYLGPYLGLLSAILSPSSLAIEIQYQWLGSPLNKIEENQWNSTVKLSAGLPGNILVSNSFGYTIKNWLSIYSGLQAIATSIYYKRTLQPGPGLPDGEKPKSHPRHIKYTGKAIQDNIPIAMDYLQVSI